MKIGIDIDNVISNFNDTLLTESIYCMTKN